VDKNERGSGKPIKTSGYCLRKITRGPLLDGILSVCYDRIIGRLIYVINEAVNAKKTIVRSLECELYRLEAINSRIARS
jgi:hypothetical protein